MKQTKLTEINVIFLKQKFYVQGNSQKYVENNRQLFMNFTPVFSFLFCLNVSADIYTQLVDRQCRFQIFHYVYVIYLILTGISIQLRDFSIEVVGFVVLKRNFRIYFFVCSFLLVLIPIQNITTYFINILFLFLTITIF